MGEGERENEWGKAPLKPKKMYPGNGKKKKEKPKNQTCRVKRDWAKESDKEEYLK